MNTVSPGTGVVPIPWFAERQATDLDFIGDMGCISGIVDDLLPLRRSLFFGKAALPVF